MADLNKDGKITQGLTQTLNGDYRIFGQSSPKYYGGFSNTVTYGGFQLDVLFQFVKQLKADPRAAALFSSNAPGALVNQDSHILSDGFKPSTLVSSPSSSAYLNYYLYSNGVYSDASFIRLRNISLSYELPHAWMKAVKIKTASLYVRGQNLLTITHYFGFDPETAGTAMPPLKMIIAGIHCSL
jgi:hypothetical protein